MADPLYDIHWSQAEALAARKVDRRRRYAVIDGQLCERAEWTTSCSGGKSIGR